MLFWSYINTTSKATSLIHKLEVKKIQKLTLAFVSNDITYFQKGTGESKLFNHM